MHAEAAADIDENPADLAGAHHAHGFAVKIEAREATQGEVEFPGAVVGLVDPPHGSEQQRHGVLRHRVGRIGRHVHHVDLAEGGPDIHVVVARRAQRNQPDAEFVKLINHGRVHIVIHKDAHRVAASGQFHRILVELCLQETEGHIVVLAVGLKGSNIVGFRVKKSNFNHFSSLSIKRK